MERRRWAVPAVALAVVAGVGWLILYQSAPEPTPAARAAEGPRAGAPREPEVPRIDLARLDRPRAESGVGTRDIFDFGQRAAAAAPPPEPEDAGPHRRPVVPPPDPEPTAPPVTVATPPPLPPLNIKYIGVLEGKRGLKVAVLMTDRKEVLTGQVGETVANRLKIVRIGVESVDVQDVGSEQVRRIPLKGN